VIGHLGRFNRADVAQIWHAPEYADMQDELLQLMINFKLCYQIPGDRDTFIAPQLLTENQPDYAWDESANLIMRYTYEFMPKGIITQFIVAINALIAEQAFVWKSGVILEKDQTRAEVVEYYGRREIKIRVAGKHQKELMTIVTYELDAIHDSYRRLKYQKLIPCNCEKCKQSQEPHFYPLDVLRQFAEDRRDGIQCHKSYDMVNVLGLIDDVITRSRPAEADGHRSREQLSASGLRQMLIEHFSNSELNDLCFDLGIDYESIKGQAKSDKARELIAHVRRHGRTDELIQLCRRLRPNANW
jgi:internalin A